MLLFTPRDSHSRLTMQNSRFTIHDSQFTIHNSQFTIAVTKWDNECVSGPGFVHFAELEHSAHNGAVQYAPHDYGSKGPLALLELLCKRDGKDVIPIAICIQICNHARVTVS